MQAIIERAIVDEVFRKKLLNNPDVIAHEYKLDSNQTRLLMNVNHESIEQFAGISNKSIVMKLGW